ncbi:MAG: UbiX family flavin prenyltransferase [Burkholderiaceae bacterium]|nr:UbiX family flavin prenyltransferase [Burkholderiaceae bacterium]
MNQASPSKPQKLIVAITGASGAQYGMRLLQALRELPQVETHLLVSGAGELNLKHELGLSRADAAALADVTHDVADVGAPPASGSFGATAMIVAPCSMRTLAAIAHGLADNLITRAADVMLKERRRLVLMTRETPLSLIHLRNMVAVTEAGGIIFPPLPALYQKPDTIDEMVTYTIGHALTLLALPNALTPDWNGMPE